MKFNKTDLNWLIFFIATLIFFSIGGRYALHDSCDFVPVYTGARCLLHGCNPYVTSQLKQQYFQAGGIASEQPQWNLAVPVYPPSTFLALVPLALLTYPVARLFWFLSNGCLFVTAAALILSMCPQSHRWFASILVSFILATSGILLYQGQPSALAISLLVIGIYIFHRDRFLLLGAILLALSLAVKPQIGGLIVLYLIARGIHRRYAAAAMAGALTLLLSGGLILSLHPSSINWTSDIHTNISTILKAGGSGDPRPANVSAIGYPNLQAITSVFFHSAREYNAAAYAIFLVFLAVLVTALQRTKTNPETYLISIGALAVLSLTPIYHRSYDARLLLITIPAIVIVFHKRRFLGVVISALTLLAVISVQFRVQTFLLNHAMWQSVLHHKFLFILLLRQQNLELPIIFCLYMVAMFTIRFPGAETIEFPATPAGTAVPG